MKYLFILFFILASHIDAKEFRIASYNVENLFDDRRDGTEYKAYIPHKKSGWTAKIYHTKLTNISRVMKDIDADIIGLCEIENTHALKDLQKMLKRKGLNYPYMRIADKRKGAVRVGLLSKFRILTSREIHVERSSRSILKTVIQIDGEKTIIYVNHWKSKRGPESRRMHYAKALKHDIDKLKDDSDFIILGDLNENYNEAKTLRYKKNKRLNDTHGKTGINHILKTSEGNTLVDEQKLTSQKHNEYLYNLWLELPEAKRFSTNSKKYKNTHDHIILSRGLYDTKGISYIDNSFKRCEQAYLFTKKGYINRWKQDRRKHSKHSGKGFSDHLCVYADFQTHK